MRREPTASSPARRRRRAGEAEPEPADMGTAYGLDLSMQAAPAPHTPAQPVVGDAPGWLDRLRRRRP